MIYKITIENFFSIADKQELIFEVPPPDLECFKPSCSPGDVRLPTVIGFFGSNASGKSTILRSIVSSVKFALHSFDWTDEISLLFQPYRQKDWWGKPTKIMIEFDCKISNDSPITIFRYELHIAHTARAFNNKAVAYEALFYAPKGKFRCLFERNEQLLNSNMWGLMILFILGRNQRVHIDLSKFSLAYIMC
jgi:uncharacterized protein